MPREAIGAAMTTFPSALLLQTSHPQTPLLDASYLLSRRRQQNTAAAVLDAQLHNTPLLGSRRHMHNTVLVPVCVHGTSDPHSAFLLQCLVFMVRNGRTDVMKSALS